MNPLPIVVRELLLASRRASTYRYRALVGLLAIIFVSVILAAMRREPDEVGLVIFWTLAFLTLTLCLLTGFSLTSDCLTEEKKEGTLGLLFLTDLKSYDILLGKLVAQSTTAVYGVLAIFPILALSFPLGGVAMDVFWRMCLLCLNALFLSLTAGLLTSTLFKAGRASVAVSFGILIFLCLIAPIPYAFYSKFMWAAHVSPLFAMSYLASSQGGGPGGMGGALTVYRDSSLTLLALSFSFLALALWALPRLWQDSGLTQRRVSVRRSLASIRTRTVRLGMNPYYWRVLGSASPSWILYLLIGAGAAMAYWIWADGGYTDAPFAIVFASVTIHSLFKLTIAFSAAATFCQDKQSGAFELLVTTPLLAEHIVQGQLLALLRRYAGPVALLLFVDVFYLFSELRRGPDILFWLGYMVTAVVDLFALAVVSMWEALKTPRVNRAAFLSLITVLPLPGAVMFLVVLISMGRIGNGGGVAFIYFGGGLGLSLFWFFRLRGQLARHLTRTMTLQSTAPIKTEAATKNVSAEVRP